MQQTLTVLSIPEAGKSFSLNRQPYDFAADGSGAHINPFIIIGADEAETAANIASTLNGKNGFTATASGSTVTLSHADDFEITSDATSLEIG